MNPELRVLQLEDVPTDAELALRELRKAGIVFTSLRTDQKETFVRALSEFRPEIILADYKLPDFDGLSALYIAREQCPDVPFLFVTGTLGEETATEMLRQGATDYILKDRLVRLGPAVQRAVEEAAERARHRQADEDLHESEEKFRLISASAQDAIVIMDPAGEVTYWNPAAEKMFGYSADEARGKDMHRLIVPARHYDAYSRGMAHFRATGEGPVIGTTQEVCALRKGGEEFPVELSLSAVRIKGQWHALGIMRDITERKAAEAVRSRMAAIVESSSDAIVGKDISGIITSWNLGAEKMYGYTAAEMIGQPIAILTPPEQQQELTEFLGKIRRGESIVHYETTRLCKDGHTIDVTLTLSPIRDMDGKIIGASTIAHDLTERNQLEARLAQASAYTRSLIEASLDPLVTISPSGKIMDVNEATERVTGAPREQLIGSEFPNYFTEPDKARQGYQQVLAEGFVKDYPLAIRHVSGTVTDVIYNATVLRNQGGEVQGVFAAARDITERKRAETALHKVNRALKTLSNCNEALVHATTENKLLQDICRILVDTGEYRMAWVGFAEHDAHKTVRPVARFGAETRYLDDVGITWADTELGRGPTGTAIRTGTTQIAQNILSDTRMEPWREKATKHGFASSIALPLRDEAGSLGALTMYSHEADAFNAEEVRLLQELAGDLAFGIVSLRTREEHQAALEQLGRSMESTIQAVAATVEMRDPYTAGHQRRVAQLGAAIATELGLDEKQIHSIHLAGIVHDLGKINIPAEILSRPGHLTEIEYKLIQVHPQAGYEILKDVEFPWPIARMVLQHHERLDGSGYPQGLKGADILLEARILSVADVVEAMTSHRPYRPGLGLDAALEEIARDRGTLYDSAAVDACLRLFKEKKFEFQA